MAAPELSFEEAAYGRHAGYNDGREEWLRYRTNEVMMKPVLYAEGTAARVGVAVEQDKKIAQLASETGAEPALARFLLEARDWSVEDAASMLPAVEEYKIVRAATDQKLEKDVITKAEHGKILDAGEEVVLASAVPLRYGWYDPNFEGGGGGRIRRTRHSRRRTRCKARHSRRRTRSAAHRSKARRSKARRSKARRNRRRTRSAAPRKRNRGKNTRKRN